MPVNEWKKYPATYLLLGLTTLTFICQYLLNGFQATSPLSLLRWELCTVRLFSTVP